MKLTKSYINSIWIFSIWPIFLFISQKSLIVFHLLNIRASRYSRDIFIWVIFCFFAVVTLSLFTLNFVFFNTHSVSHFISYFIFIIYSVLIAGVLSSPYDSNRILKLITILNFFGLLLIHIIYFNEIELPGNRGLNFIRGTDDIIHRFFVETSPLFLISRFDFFKKKILKILFISITLSYFLIISKNTFLSSLFILQLIYRYQKSLNIYQLFVSLIFLGLLSFTGFINWSSLIRADLILSIFFKAEQLFSIFKQLGFHNIFLGEGFGFFLNEFATDLNQPYQIEMQLPMLILQIGLLNCFMLILGIYLLFKSTNIKYSFLTTGLFFSVGFINPWLFLPAWLIACIYFFK